MVYHGPREEVMPFFNSLGFSIPHRKGVADFLQEVRLRVCVYVRTTESTGELGGSGQLHAWVCRTRH